MHDSHKALVHDVAKYIVRTAQNVAHGPIPAALWPLLIRDLYGGPGEPAPFERFDELSEGLDEDTLHECTQAFDRLHQLEAQVRTFDEDATQSALSEARLISSAILAAVSKGPI